jgi:hypothetical protein
MNTMGRRGRLDEGAGLDHPELHLVELVEQIVGEIARGLVDLVDEKDARMV